MSDRYFLRCEFFGGYLFHRDSLESWIINKDTMLFAVLWLETKNMNLAVSVTNKVFSKAHIDFNVLSFLENCISNERITANDFDGLVSSSKHLMVKLSNREYLSFPFNVELYPTFQCLAKCKFCFLVDKSSRISLSNTSESMNLLDWKRLVSESSNNGASSIAVLGGDPVLYKDIESLLEHIESVNISTVLTTVGQSLQPSVEELLLKSKCVQTCFSIQALNEKNIYLMNVPHEKTVETIRGFSRNRGDCGLNTVLTIQTYDDIKEIIDFCFAYGVETYSVSICFPKKNEELITYKLSDIRVLSERIQEYIDSKTTSSNILEFNIEGCMLFSSYHDIAYNYSLASNFQAGVEYELIKHGCACGNGNVSIDCLGFVYPCCVYMNTDKRELLSQCGNLKSLWDTSPILEQFRNYKRISVLECTGCNFNTFCKGGCPYLIEKDDRIIGIHREQRCEVVF